MDVAFGGPPYKCPECGVWWAGLEHRCTYPITDTTTTPRWYPPIDTSGTAPRCSRCGGVPSPNHYCISYQTWS